MTPCHLGSGQPMSVLRLCNSQLNINPPHARLSLPARPPHTPLTASLPTHLPTTAHSFHTACLPTTHTCQPATLPSLDCTLVSVLHHLPRARCVVVDRYYVLHRCGTVVGLPLTASPTPTPTPLPLPMTSQMTVVGKGDSSGVCVWL